MQKLKDVKDLVQEAIDKGARSVEEVHQAIASKPFEVLEKVAPDLGAPAKSIEDLQHKTIGNVYDTIRRFNQTVGEVAESLLGKIDKGDKS